MKYRDLSGKKFGRLTVIKYDHSEKNRGAYFECICDCGNHCVVRGSQLVTKSRPTRSCGCLQKEKAKEHLAELEKEGKVKHDQRRTHGMSKTRIYHIWLSMKKRCDCKKYEHYENYGGKGIKVCDEWNKSFEEFYKWALKNGYEENLSIDRIDVNGNYCPENCRFANQKAQVRNRTNTVFLTHEGDTKTLMEWCEKYDIEYKLAHERYLKGFPFEKIFYKGNLRKYIGTEC